jgi:predicted naringenin-chalcone synthase
LSKIISIATALPAYKHEQKDILSFMQTVYGCSEEDKRKLRFLYKQSAIDTRYSVVPDYSVPAGDWAFYPATENLEPFPGLEKRMEWYNNNATILSIHAINNCLEGITDKSSITHLITVSCTGMSAPGLDLMIVEQMQLPVNIFRTSVNFMGCYAAVHALKLAHAFCESDAKARVIIVATELCTLHFQKEATPDNIASSLLFADGAAAVLVTNNNEPCKGIFLRDFYSEVSFRGKKDMSWELSSSGFLMTLTGYVPALIEEDFDTLVSNSLTHAGLSKEDITHWCIHPGGRKILESIGKSLQVPRESFKHSYNVLQQYGNMSSPTILFVLKEIMEEILHDDTIEKANSPRKPSTIFSAAFGPGLTMETFVASI